MRKQKHLNLFTTNTSIFTLPRYKQWSPIFAVRRWTILSATDGLHDCFSHLKKDRNPPIASRRLTFWTLCFFPQRSALIKTKQWQPFFLSSSRNILRSLCRVKEWWLSCCPFFQASMVHNRLPYMCYRVWIRRYPDLLYKHQWNTKWAFPRKLHIFTREDNMLSSHVKRSRALSLLR